MAFKCKRVDGELVVQGSAREIPHRDCGGDSSSAAELFAGYEYDAEHSEPPVPVQVVEVEACGMRKLYRVTSRVDFEAELIELCDEREGEASHG